MKLLKAVPSPSTSHMQAEAHACLGCASLPGQESDNESPPEACLFPAAKIRLQDRSVGTSDSVPTLLANRVLDGPEADHLDGLASIHSMVSANGWQSAMAFLPA